MNNELLTKTQLEAWNSSFEISELRKDKERLDWIFKYCGVTYDRFFSTSFVNREEVDKAMEKE